MKKRSGTRDPKQPSETFFVDRDLGSSLTEVLREAGMHCLSDTEVYPTADDGNAPTDDEWIRLTGERNWIALTKDNEIKRTPSSVQAIMESGARVFIVRGPNLKHSELAAMIVESLPSIRRFIDRHSAPFLAIVKRVSAPRGSDGYRFRIHLHLGIDEWTARRDPS